MIILVLMAGRGQRFVDGGYSIPKPLIYYKDMTILEHTTRSCPFINHNNLNTQNEYIQNRDVRLVFACLEEHRSLGIDAYLYKTYGKNVDIVWFPKITRGNLDTAYQSIQTIYSKISTQNNLLIIDSDNKYNHNGFDRFLSRYGRTPDMMSICGFDPVDNNPKWANAVLNNGVVVDIREKDPDYVTHPAMIGTFYFDTVRLFLRYAKYILTHTTPVKNDEFYMSQVPALYARLEYPTYFHKVTEVIPLGTPEDLEKVSS